MIGGRFCARIVFKYPLGVCAMAEQDSVDYQQPDISIAICAQFLDSKDIMKNF